MKHYANKKNPCTTVSENILGRFHSADAIYAEHLPLLISVQKKEFSVCNFIKIPLSKIPQLLIPSFIIFSTFEIFLLSMWAVKERERERELQDKVFYNPFFFLAELKYLNKLLFFVHHPTGPWREKLHVFHMKNSLNATTLQHKK